MIVKSQKAGEKAHAFLPAFCRSTTPPLYGTIQLRTVDCR